MEKMGSCILDGEVWEDTDEAGGIESLHYNECFCPCK